MKARRISFCSPGARRWLAEGCLPLLLVAASGRVSLAPSAAAGQAISPTPGASAPLPGSIRSSLAKTAWQWMLEGQKAQKAGDQMEAVSDFLHAQRLEPASPEPLYAEGMSFFLLGWDENDMSYYDRAARHFKAALELDPKYDRAAFMMGMMEVVHFRLKQAKPYFQQAISLSPQNPYYRLYYGTLLQRMDKCDAAIEQMRLAEKLDHTYVQAYLTLGQLYAQKRQYQEARSQLERAVQLDRKRAEAYYTLGSVYHHLGMNAESQSSYMTFQQLKASQPKPDPLARAMQGGSAADPK
jgi:tetratricopeptide (TPR) repeat protein